MLNRNNEGSETSWAHKEPRKLEKYSKKSKV